MCRSSGQREGLSRLRSAKGQDFKGTSQISFQLKLFVTVSIYFGLTCAITANGLAFAIITAPGWDAHGKSPTPALLP